jgi:hypothetical protein
MLGLRDALELLGLVLVTAAAAVGAGLWPALAVGGAAAVYVSHAWVFGGGPEDVRTDAGEQAVQALEAIRAGRTVNGKVLDQVIARWRVTEAPADADA